MPIYEFYCGNCNTIFNFFSKSVNTSKRPKCPRCEKKNLERHMSVFSVVGNAEKENDVDDLPIDEGKLNKAMHMLAREAENMNEDDPKQAAGLMRKLTCMTDMELGSGMQEALERIESGEDPDVIEKEMGDLMEGEDPFVIAGKKSSAAPLIKNEPEKDDTLYDL